MDVRSSEQRAESDRVEVGRWAVAVRREMSVLTVLLHGAEAAQAVAAARGQALIPVPVHLDVGGVPDLLGRAD